MTNQEMYEMRKSGTTYQAIADLCGISKQAVYTRVYYYKRKVLGIRGRGFDIEKIVYQGIYDWFKENFDESPFSLFAKIYKNGSSTRLSTFRNFLKGEHDTFFSIKRIKKLCEVIGKPFEEVFKRRDEV